MKIKVSEATNTQLNWLVTMAIGEYKPTAVPNYTTDWSEAGPIIEREGITVVCWAMRPEPDWMARLWLELNGRASVAFRGSTPLIAAMRCYVSLVLGDEVDVPDELGSR